jgi:hypothetical protein
MAISCSLLNTTLARQTPVFDKEFLKDFISDMPGLPYIGRHQTETWEDGAEARVFDKVHVGQPDYTAPWNRRTGRDCGNTSPPRQWIAGGTTRDEYWMENKNLVSQLWDLDQLRTIPNLAGQIREMYRNIRRIPMGFTADFLRTRFLAYNDTLYICGSNFTELPLNTGYTVDPTTGYIPAVAGGANIDPNASTINLGASVASVVTSDLSLAYLNYYQQLLGMKGYDQESGMAKGMRNLVTHQRTYQRLVGQNPEVKAQLHLAGVKDVSPLYQIGTGINADPFGSFAPTFDDHQLRYQDAGNGVLTRVLPYYNAAASTGLKPVVNPAYLNARVGISYLIHPKATVLLTPKPKKVHEMIPTVNSAMWGTWDYINDRTMLYQQQDGSTCTIDNINLFKFYWACYMELGFKYEQRPLVVAILHLIDGAGKACTVDVPICGEEPQYSQYSTSDNPPVCQI